MNEKSKKGAEYFRTDEYNSIRNSSSRLYSDVSETLTSLDFDESTHRKKSYASSLSASDKRSKQKDLTKIATLAAAGTFSVVAIVAVVIAVVTGITFVSFSATPTTIACVAEIPEEMDGLLTGVLYDASGEEVSRTEVEGSGTLKFSFSDLRPDTEYFFSILDSENNGYLYESVRTTPSTEAVVTETGVEYFPYAVRVSLATDNPSDEDFTVYVTFDEDESNVVSYRLGDERTVTADSQGSSTARITITDGNGTVRFDTTYALPYLEYTAVEGVSVNGRSASARILLETSEDVRMQAVAVSKETGEPVANVLIQTGENDVSFDDLPAGDYMLCLKDGLGKLYEVEGFSIPAASR